MSFETAVQIVALRKAGKTTEETGRLVGISRRTVERFEKDKGKYAMLPNIDNEIKTLLPAHFRKLALVCLKDAMSKSKRASASHRDLMISVGILLDKAILVETGGRDPLKDILAIIQARVDTSEKDRLRELIGTNPDVTEAEVVKPVQPCPDNPPKSNAPKNDKEFPTTTPPWERV